MAPDIPATGCYDGVWLRSVNSKLSVFSVGLLVVVDPAVVLSHIHKALLIATVTALPSLTGQTRVRCTLGLSLGRSLSLAQISA